MQRPGRCSGILMPVSALPSPNGIGCFGREAFRFADFLSACGQSIWQMLPLGPTSFGDSPYQSFSSFAGNPYFVDLEQLAGQDLLTDTEISSVNWGDRPEVTDYGRLYAHRHALLRLAWERARSRVELMNGLAAFRRENTDWLEDYALFMALKRHFGMAAWYDWPGDIRSRDCASLDDYRNLLSDEIELECFIQYCFFSQLNELRRYCRELGLHLMGDLPIYAALDSADVWASPEEFQLDSNFSPTAVAGVPPDYFSETGQLWGNPLYRWAEMRENDFRWWKRRIGAAAKIYDLIRLDHFRGLESYWSVPGGSPTAEKGKWVPGPGPDFIRMLRESFPDTVFVAEDLGMITDEVRALRKLSGMPGMAVLSFAFDPKCESSYLPHNLEKNCVCYTGTHDNAPLGAFCAELDADTRTYIANYCGEASPLAILRSGMTSPAGIFIAQMQDWLGLGIESRMNTPGADRGCWQWRMTPEQLTDTLRDTIYHMTWAARRGRPEKEEDSR